MGLLDRIKRVTNPDDDYQPIDGNYYDNDEDLGYEEEPIKGDGGRDTIPPAAMPDFSPSMGMNLSGNIELKVVKPASYKDTNQIADHLLAGRTVVLNLEATNKETARRLIDFLTGVAYSIGGDIKKVSTNTYVITPKNVAVSSDAMRDRNAAAGEVNNQGQQINDFYSELQ